MPKNLTYTSLLVVLISIIFIILVIGALYFLTYEKFLTYSLSFSQISPLHINNIKQKFLTPFIFQTLKISISLFLIGFLICFLFFFKKIKANFFSFCTSFQEKTNIQLRFFQFKINKVKQNPQKFIFISLFFCVIIFVFGYYAIYFPAFEDEVFAYTFLVSRGFLVNIFYYPGPNHHVFFDILACFVGVFDIFFVEKYHILRFVSVICVGILGVKFANNVYKNTDKSTGFLQNIWIFCLFSAIFLVQSPLFLMGFLGRGYALQILIGYVLTKKILQNRLTHHNNSIIFWVSLGFYTIPTFLYMWGSLSIYLVIYFIFNKKKDLIYLKSNFTKFLIDFCLLQIKILCVIFLLYSPIFLVSGFGSVFANDWVKSLSYGDFFAGFFVFLYKIFDYLFPIFPHFFGFLLGILSIFLLFFAKKNQKILYFSLILTPFSIIFLQKVLPPERVFTYFYVIFLAIFVEFLCYLKNIFSKNYYFYFNIICFFGFLILFYFSKNNIKTGFKQSEYQIFAKDFVKDYRKKYLENDKKHSENQIIFVKDLSYKTYLMYEFLKAKKENPKDFPKNFFPEIVLIQKNK